MVWRTSSTRSLNLSGSLIQRHLPGATVAAHQALENPSAESVELGDPAHIDLHSLGLIWVRVLYRDFQARGVVGGPGAESRDFELLRASPCKGQDLSKPLSRIDAGSLDDEGAAFRGEVNVRDEA